MPKYLITNKKTKISETIEARKKPDVDLDDFSVVRIREKITTLTSNQRHKKRRESRDL